MARFRAAFEALHSKFAELATVTGAPAPVLGEPATAQELASVERALGSPLPPLVRELLAAANGWTHVPMGERPLPWFSCRELVSPEYTALVEEARATRGFKRERNVQAGFIIGGDDNYIVVVTPEPAPQIVIYGLRPRAQGMTGPPERFFEGWTRAIEANLATKREAVSRAPLQRVDDAIAAFNYPSEMGDDVHYSVETMQEIIDSLPADDAYLPALRRLLAELERGYLGKMRFDAARRRNDRVEVRVGRAWVDIALQPGAKS